MTLVWCMDDEGKLEVKGLEFNEETGEFMKNEDRHMKEIKCIKNNNRYMMSNEEFDIMMSDMFEHCKNILSYKAEEYARGPRLSAFHKAGIKSGQIPEKALLGFLLKHTTSIDDIVDDIEKGILPDYNIIMEKFGDVINYYILLMALINERKLDKLYNR